jgi:peptide/nickel transport system permease protein
MMPGLPIRAAGPGARLGAGRSHLLSYTGWRLVQLVIVLIGVSMVVFFTMHVLPGDVALLLLGDRGTAEQLARLRLQLGLDQPVIVQYLRFVADAVQGDFGTSLTSNHSAFADVSTAFPVTLQLTLAALSLATLIGVPVGVIASLRPGGSFDNVAMTFTLFGVSMPIFWLGLMLLLLFGATLDWLPIGGLSEVGMEPPRVTGMSIIDAALTGNRSMLWDALRHLVLPACTLATIPLALIARITRAEMLATATQDHVRTARAKGLPRGRVVLRHILRNALIPIVTVIGLQLGLLLSGAVLTETIFSLPGLGRLMVDSIQSRDYPVVQAGALVIAVVFVLVNLAVDLSYTLLDPRIGRG